MNSARSVQRVPDGPIEIIPDERGYKKMPSWVSFSKKALVWVKILPRVLLSRGSFPCSVGERAKDAFPDNLDTTVMYPKHLIGRIMNDDLAAELDRWYVQYITDILQPFYICVRPFPLFEQDPVVSASAFSAKHAA
jgi:hypothetical protein